MEQSPNLGVEPASAHVDADKGALRVVVNLRSRRDRGARGFPVFRKFHVYRGFRLSATFDPNFYFALLIFETGRTMHKKEEGGLSFSKLSVGVEAWD